MELDDDCPNCGADLDPTLGYDGSIGLYVDVECSDGCPQTAIWRAL